MSWYWSFVEPCPRVQNFLCSGNNFLTTCAYGVNLSLSLSISLWLYSPCVPRPLFQFLNIYTVGRIPWTGDEPVARPLYTHRTTQTQNKRTQTSMPWVGLEPTIPASERAKTVHDRAATPARSEPVDIINTNNSFTIIASGKAPGKMCMVSGGTRAAWSRLFLSRVCCEMSRSASFHTYT
jgi:hypothetical protein